MLRLQRVCAHVVLFDLTLSHVQPRLNTPELRGSPGVQGPVGEIHPPDPRLLLLQRFDHGELLLALPQHRALVARHIAVLACLALQAVNLKHHALVLAGAATVLLLRQLASHEELAVLVPQLAVLVQEPRSV